MADATVDIGVRSDLRNEKRIATDFDTMFKAVKRTTTEVVKVDKAIGNASRVMARHRTVIRHLASEYTKLNTQLVKANSNLITLGRRRQGIEANARAMSRVKLETIAAVNATNRLNQALARNRAIAAAPARSAVAAAANTAVAANTAAGASSAASLTSVAAQSAALGRLDTIQRRVTRSAFQLSTAFNVIASSLALLVIIRASDEYISLNNRLRVITDTTQDFQQALTDVERISRVSQSAIRTTTSTYARFQLASEKLGTTQRQIAAATEAVNLSFLISGSTAREAEAATVQLAQGLSSGKFSGDELRSVLENNIVLARDLADALGTNVGFLRDLAAEGALNQSAVLNTLIRRLPEYRKAAEDIELTFARAFEQLNNGLVLYLGQTAGASDATGAMIDGIVLLRENLDVVIPVLVGLTAGFIAYKAAATAIVIVHRVITVSVGAMTLGITGLTTALAYATTATRVFSAALIANPIGAAVFFVGLATAAYYDFGAAADSVANSLRSVNDQAERNVQLRSLNTFAFDETGGRYQEPTLSEFYTERQALRNRGRDASRDRFTAEQSARRADRANAGIDPVQDAARLINIPALITSIRRDTDTELQKLQRREEVFVNAYARLTGAGGELETVQAAIAASNGVGTREQQDNLRTIQGNIVSLEQGLALNRAAQATERTINRTELLPVNQRAAQDGRSEIDNLNRRIAVLSQTSQTPTYASNANDIQNTLESIKLERDILTLQQRSLGIQNESADVQALINSNLTDRQRIQQQIVQVQQTLAAAESPEAQQQLENLLTVLEVRARRAVDTLPELASVFDNMRSDAQRFGDASGQAFTSFALGARSASQAARQLLQDIINIAAQRVITEPIANVAAIGIRAGFDALLSGGVGRDTSGATTGGSGFIPSSTPRAATGIYGTFGGLGGTDNNVLSMNGNPFLRVSRNEDFEVVPQGGKRGGGGGGTTIIEVNSPITIGLGIQEGIASEVRQVGEQLPSLIRAEVTHAIANRQIVI